MKEKATKSVIEPVNEEEAKEFLKFLKHSEYSVMEQLRKQPARISMLALLLSSDVHRSALMKVLNETYVANDISVNKLDRLVSNISVNNYIFFNDDEIPPGGMGSTKALHITMRCNGYTLPGVLIDNGLALNVLPFATLNRLPIDSSHMKECQNIVKAFDGTERRVMGRIEEKRDRFGLGFKPTARQWRKELEEKESAVNGGGNQVGANDIPPHIENLCVLRNHSS
ncbi:hypothetical protein PVK06_040074 [Gossypium arboreum]|uniref:Uncharacterized protein n=1 Tax=Gossypium arboreum TaxID=29729 RepID=A0ABR0N4I6_GOSAR|nr:hypothetical protein PVK06_040074 [Gossypium arboreum]